VDGVVLGVEKILMSKLLKPGSNKQIATLGEHQGMVFSGWAPDARQLVAQGRHEIQNYKDTFGICIPPALLAERLAQYVHYFTLHGGLRPFGIGAMVCGYDAETKTHALHMIEPNGVQYRYFGAALGKGRMGAKTEIEKLDLKNITCREALKHIAKIIHTLHEEGKDKPFELELSWLCEESNWKHMQVPEALKNESEEAAKKEIEDAEMEDSDDEEEDDE
jgi:20S proteasome subunit alpha 7